MFRLDTDILKISRVGQATAKRLKKIGIENVNDLLFYFPFRYDDFSEISKINKLQAGASANIVGQIELIQNRRSFRKRMYVTEALVSDGSETLKVIWFNQPFIARNLKVGDRISLSGKVDGDYHDVFMKSPVYEKIGMGLAVHTQGLVPSYHLTANITQKQIRFLIKQIIKSAELVADWLPAEIQKKLKLISLPQAISKIHFPKNQKHINDAKRRLAFDEIFLIQLQSQLSKLELQEGIAEPIAFKEKETNQFVKSLEFKLTDSQRKASWSVLQDLSKNKPMSRLLEGDVGSGKTLVAVVAMLNVALNGGQAVLMAPTEILAEQHYNTICKLLAGFNIKIGLITRNKKVVDNSKIIIGTHALIQDKVNFEDLSLVIVDEQHRFGVNQRSALITRTNTDKHGLMQNISDKEKNDKTNLLFEDLTYKIRGAIFKVKKELGLGHKEKIYQNALEQEFIKSKINFEKEKSININYDNKKIGVYRPDFVVEDKIIVELKKLPFVGKFEKDQIWYYLKGSKYQLALLVNFANDDVQIQRFIHTKVCVGQHKSVSSVLRPHFLSMTATPIPRSLALALYGDLDLSVINEMPKGRKKILTKIIGEEKRQQAYNFIRQEIENGRQAFVVCPLIDISDKLGVKSVKEEYKKLNEIIFPELKIGILHGKMKSLEKEKVMRDFWDNKIKILVSTSVVEVGVDVPNATIMMIEGADRFGLAQIHQFRGRVGRSDFQSYCFLFTDSESVNTRERLQAVVDYHSGLELAKMDLKFRGPGEVYGTIQKGFPELKIASLYDYELMKLAKEQADVLIKKDKSLNSWPGLKEKLGQRERRAHLE